MFVEQEISSFVAGLNQHFVEQTPAETPAPAGGPRRLVVLHHGNAADIDCLQQLRAQLNPWIQEGRLELWHPGSALHGDVLAQMLEQIGRADAVLPILSADFLADPDQAPLLEAALRQHRERGLRLVPLLYRACTWEETDLGDFAPLPERDKPLRNWPDADSAFTLVAERLKLMLNYG